MEKKSIQIEDLLSVSNIDEINTLISQLSSEEKAELMQKLLGRSGLMVVLGGSNVTTSDLVIQIHSTANLDLSDLLRAIRFADLAKPVRYSNCRAKTVQGQEERRSAFAAPPATTIEWFAKGDRAPGQQSCAFGEPK